jgi:hypothetical protein
MATITREWIAQNVELYKQLLERKPTHCPICYEALSGKDADSPLLSDIPSTCTHWCCKECWQKVASTNAECPICREDLSPWLLQHGKLTTKEVRKFLISVMCMQGGSEPVLTHDQMFDVSQKLFHHSFS